VCTGGATLCGSTCVDLNTNAMHYGGCDRRCSMPDGGSAPGSCVAGMCGDGVCALGFHVCAGSCVSNSSPTSCGTRCTACPLVANGTPTCDGTNCGFECNRGFVMGGGGCVPGPTCGNGTLDAAETCDDGNATSGDGCDMNCQIEADAFVESCAQTPVTIPIRRNQVILLRAQSGTMNNGTGPAGCNADGNEVVAAVRAIDTGTLTIVATPVAPMGSWDLILRYGLGACPGDQCTDAGGGSGRSETATLSIATANQMVAVNVDGNRGSDNGTFTVRLELR
jgi:cysteine-rich repeat protein